MQTRKMPLGMLRAAMAAVLFAGVLAVGMMAVSQTAQADELGVSDAIAVALQDEMFDGTLAANDLSPEAVAAPKFVASKASWKKAKAKVYPGYYLHFYGVKIKAKAGLTNVKVKKKSGKKIVTFKRVVKINKPTKAQILKMVKNLNNGVAAESGDDIVFTGVDWRYRNQNKLIASAKAKYGTEKITKKTIYPGTKYEMKWPVKMVKKIKITVPSSYKYLTIAMGQKNTSGKIKSYKYIRIK